MFNRSQLISESQAIHERAVEAERAQKRTALDAETAARDAENAKLEAAFVELGATRAAEVAAIEEDLAVQREVAQAEAARAVDPERVLEERFVRLGGSNR